MSNDHQQFLERLHETMTTSPELINEVVIEAAGKPIDTKQRLVAGEVNEVWSATTQDGRNIIVRISHSSEPAFENERWALDAARDAGVPTPEVLLIKQIADGDKQKTVCVETALEGVPLSKIELNKQQEQSFAAEIAATLEKIHSVRVDGFSYSHQATKPSSFADQMIDRDDQRAELQALAKQAGIPAHQIDKTLEILLAHRPLFETITQATLTHGDFGADHLFFNNGKLCGVIDMENAKGGHISYDLAWWDYYWRSKIPTATIISSLKHKSDNLDTLIDLQGLRQGLHMLQYYTDTKNPKALELVSNNLDRYLTKFA